MPRATPGNKTGADYAPVGRKKISYYCLYGPRDICSAYLSYNAQHIWEKTAGNHGEIPGKDKKKTKEVLERKNNPKASQRKKQKYDSKGFTQRNTFKKIEIEIKTYAKRNFARQKYV